MLTCKHCGKEKEEKEFSVHLGCASGYDVSKCKACKKKKISLGLDKSILREKNIS